MKTAIRGEVAVATNNNKNTFFDEIATTAFVD
jgi:hypothetical protein